jgi:hypothetical protein
MHKFMKMFKQSPTEKNEEFKMGDPEAFDYTDNMANDEQLSGLDNGEK